MPRGVGSGAGEFADGLMSKFMVLWLVLFSVTIRDADSAAAGAGLGYMDPGRAPIAEDLPYELVGERERPGAKEPLDARRRPRRSMSQCQRAASTPESTTFEGQI